MQGWFLTAAAYWSEGENRQNGQPLNSISPPQAVFGVNWHSASETWDLELTSTLTAAKKDSDIDLSTGSRFASDSWTSFDLTAGWQANDSLELRAGIFNIGDQTYWRWLDVSRLEANDPMIPVLSRPGRNYSVTIRFQF
jgi:hemoglobin/transferrin/lactoferrin receptor protein